MSTIALSCPGCGKRYELSATLAGKKARCKACSHEFSIPVPRQVAAVAAPASTLPSSPRPASTPRPSRPSAPPPPPILDEFNPYSDIEEDAGGSAVVSYDDDETYLPPRAGRGRAFVGEEAKPKKAKKKSRSGSSSSSSAGLWVIAPLGGIALTILLTIAAFVVKPFAMIFLGLIILSGAALVLGGWIWGLVYSFLESITCGLLYVIFPVYGLAYAVTRWDKMKGPFTTFFVGGCMIVVMTIFFALAHLGDQAIQNRANHARPGNARVPHVGFQRHQPANPINNPAPQAGFQPNQPAGMNNIPGMPQQSQPGGMNNMPGMPQQNQPVGANNMPGPPPGFPQHGPGGMNNMPGPPNGFPRSGRIGPRFGRPGNRP